MKTFYVLIVITLFAAACLLTRNPLAVDDGLRHFVFAGHMREEGVSSVTWSNFLFRGYLSDHELDPWFLADASFIPFTFIPNRVIGVKTAGFAFAVIFFSALLLFFRLYRTDDKVFLLFMVLLVLGSPLFTYRLLIARPYTLMTAIFLCTLFLIIRRRFTLIIPLLAIAALFSHLFVFPLILSLVAGFWLFFFCHERANSFKCMFFALFGTLTGVLIHPWTAQYFAWLKNGFFSVLLSKDLGIGGELYSGFTTDEMGPFILLIAIILVAFRIAHRGELRSSLAKRPEIILTSILAAGLLFAYSMWARAIDFFWPVAIILLLQLITVSESAMIDIFSMLKKSLFPLGVRGAHVLVVLLVFSSLFLVSTIFLHDGNRNPYYVSPVTGIPGGSTVFNLDWDFTSLYLFFNDDVRYARMADPTLDDMEVRKLVSPLFSTGIIPDFDGSVKNWWTEFSGRINWKTLSVNVFREEEADVGLWLKDLCHDINPEYVVLGKKRWEQIYEGMKNHPDSVLFSENEVIAVFYMR